MAKKRRMKRNRRTLWGSFGAFILGWLLTTSSVLATVDDTEASAALRSMWRFGLIIVFGLLLVGVIVALVRWLEVAVYDHVAKRLGSGIPPVLHTIGWGLTILSLVGPIGLSVAWMTQPFGLTYWETAATITLTLVLLAVSGAFVLGPAERRRAATHGLLSESVAAETIAIYSPGEELTLKRIDELEVSLMEAIAAVSVHPARRCATERPVLFTSWGDWWRARPSRVSK